MSLIVLNGEFLSADSAFLSPENRSFRYGDGLFETIRIYQGQLPFWKAHMQRLYRCGQKLGMELATRLESDLQIDSQKLIQQQSITGHGRLRITLFRQAHGAYAPDGDQIGYLIEASEMKGNPFADTPPATLLPYRDIMLYFSTISGCKTTSALPYVLASREARKLGYDEAIMFSGKQVAEASSSNIFAIRKGKVFTPPLSSGCLDGVMRGMVIELCQKLKIEMKEKRLTEKFLSRSDEVFITSAIRGVVPVRQIGEMIHLPALNPLTLFLRNNLIRLAEKSVQDQ